MPLAPHASEILATFGQRLFGSEWAAPLARLTGTSERTVRRVRAAAAEGREYPAARGILAALQETLAAVAADLAKHGRP